MQSSIPAQIEAWNVSNVRDMTRMFARNAGFNQPRRRRRRVDQRAPLAQPSVQTCGILQSASEMSQSHLCSDVS